MNNYTLEANKKLFAELAELHKAKDRNSSPDELRQHFIAILFCHADIAKDAMSYTDNNLRQTFTKIYGGQMVCDLMMIQTYNGDYKTICNILNDLDKIRDIEANQDTEFSLEDLIIKYNIGAGDYPHIIEAIKAAREQEGANNNE